MTETAVFGGGCFWCTEAILQQLKGVVTVTSGYAGGTVPNPTYEEVSSGSTGHAEVVKIEFDPHQISYRNLLTVFFASHDPTTPDRQGADVGSQYRSIILYTNNTQRQQSEQFIQEVEDSAQGGNPIVTHVAPLTAFYQAEAEHRDFYTNNPWHPYSLGVISPKLKKVRAHLAHLIQTHL
ncbi:MAG: peptide-methionine (S)-S-oxide reductase MsrA [Acidobacteriota bacterium]